MRGSEELYRSMGFQPSYVRSQPVDELGMAERQMDRDTDERRRRRQENTRASERQEDRIAQVGRDAPQAYMNAADWSKNQNAMDEESQQRQQNLRHGEQTFEKSRMENAELARDKKLRDLEANYWTGEEESGKGPRLVSKAAAGYADYMDELKRQPKRRNTEEEQQTANLEGTKAGTLGTIASTELTKKHTAIAGSAEGLQRRQQLREQMQDDIAEAVQSGDPQLLEDARKRWGAAKAGFSSTDVRLAEAKGQRVASANRAAKEFAAEAAAQGTQQGAAAMAAITKVRQDKDSLQTIAGAVKDYQSARAGSAEADRAAEDVINHLMAMGKQNEAEQVQKFLTVDTAGPRSRQKVMADVLKRLVIETKRKLTSAAATSHGVESRSIKAQLVGLQQELDALEAGANGRVNLIGGGSRPAPAAGANANFTTQPAPAPAPPQGGAQPAGVNLNDVNRQYNNRPPASPTMRNRAIAKPGAATQLQAK